jgi:hypothetical protein
MGADASEVIALYPDHGPHCAALDAGCHLPCRDMLGGRVEAEDRTRIKRVTRSNLCKTASACSHRAERVSS